MNTRSTLNALFGVWFLLAPWILDFSGQTGAMWTSVIIGLVQFIAALWSYNKSGWGTWQDWVTFITGVWFIIFPFAYSLNGSVEWISVILGLLTAIFSLWNLSGTSE
ncbi:SPW repeat protein [Heyndrickxia acidicola]|jgi:hypothetical protein|uniref:SPW repeat protein n=1 Tax=Heyndrickxia acidicola TaxID=209389 RepID=A0ABU6MH30_9BACI|nr:SPW repeat protein [Heyndrickxia acidicola]MED1203810.1 SPW repeat protein [Heyndrickxia acidicola]